MYAAMWHDLTICLCRNTDQKLKLNDTIKALEKAAKRPVPRADLTGHWRLVCTNSDSSSGGKFGPFIGPVEQARQPASAAAALQNKP